MIDRSRGSVLIITLWSLCLLATFAVILGYSVRQKLTLVKRLDERDKLRLISEAGIMHSLAKLQEEDATFYDALNEQWSNDSEAYKEIKVGDGEFSVCHTYFDDNLDSLAYRYGLADQERKININTADNQLLEKLFKSVLGYDEVLSQELAASIIDWRDVDNMLSIPLGSAEDAYYRDLPRPYEAKDAPYEVIEELLLVKGVDAGALERLKPYITLYGEGRINVKARPEGSPSSAGARSSCSSAIQPSSIPELAG